MLWISKVVHNGGNCLESMIPDSRCTAFLAAFLVYRGPRTLAGTGEGDISGTGAGREESSRWPEMLYAGRGASEKFGMEGVIEFDQARTAIQAALSKGICRDSEKYGAEYVPAPPWFFQGSATLDPSGVGGFGQTRDKTAAITSSGSGTHPNWMSLSWHELGGSPV